MKGWVYIVANEAMKGLLKIGYTSKTPEKRAKELDGTSSPLPHTVLYAVKLYQAEKVEKDTHKRLQKYHVGKEWFRCDITLAIDRLRESSDRMVNVEYIDKSLVGTVAPIPKRILKSSTDRVDRKLRKEQSRIQFLTQEFMNHEQQKRDYAAVLKEENKILNKVRKEVTPFRLEEWALLRQINIGKNKGRILTARELDSIKLQYKQAVVEKEKHELPLLDEYYSQLASVLKSRGESFCKLEDDSIENIKTKYLGAERREDPNIYCRGRRLREYELAVLTGSKKYPKPGRWKPTYEKVFLKKCIWVLRTDGHVSGRLTLSDHGPEKIEVEVFCGISITDSCVLEFIRNDYTWDAEAEKILLDMRG